MPRIYSPTVMYTDPTHLSFEQFSDDQLDALLDAHTQYIEAHYEA